MHNLLTGIFLLALAALAVVVLLFHQLAPPLAPEPPPNLETDAFDDGARVVAVVGNESNPPAVSEEALRAALEERERFLKSLEPDGTIVVAPPNKDGVLVIRVGKGDTLSSLAKTHLGDAGLWRAILDANPSLTRAEDLQEGQTLRIPLREGR